MRRHLVPLAGMLGLVAVVFARLLFTNADGIPLAIIPWDFRSIGYPWLTYASDTLRSGHFPLWCPYAGAGTPFFAFGTNQLDSPLTIGVSFLFGYTLRVAQVQQVFMLFVAGAGAYAWAASAWNSRWSGLIAGITFGCSSALFTNLEQGLVVSDFAIAPWLFWASDLALRSGRSWAAPLLAFLIDFLLTSGYPHVSAMVLLFVAAYTVSLMVQAERKEERVRRAAAIGAAWTLGIGLAAVYWVPMLWHRREITRSLLSIDEALATSVTFKNLWGVLFPFLPVAPLPGTNPDISNRGLYVGALMLPLAVVTVKLVRGRFVAALSLLLMAAALLTVGRTSFVRYAFHLALPVFNLSRQSAYDSRGLVALFLVMLGAGGARHLTASLEAIRTAAHACYVILIAMVAGIVALRSLVPPAEFDEVVLNYGSAEIIFLGVGMLALSAVRGRALVACWSGLLALEVGTCAMANAGVIGQPLGPQEYRALASHSQEFTVAAALGPRSTDGLDPRATDENAAKAYTQKRFYLTEYNGFRLRRLDALLDAGFAQFLERGARVVAIPIGSHAVQWKEFERLLRPVTFAILEYGPNQVRYHLDQSTSAVIVLNEIYFPGWQSSIDGGPWTPMAEIGPGLRATVVPEGRHELYTRFRPNSWYVSLTMTSSSLVVLLGWIVVLTAQKRRAARLV